MTKWLDKDDYLPHAPTSRGKVRVNHTSDNCEGGRDSMIVERKDDGSVSAYCFRCGCRGFFSADKYFSPPAAHATTDGGGSSGSATSRSTPPNDAHNVFTAFPREVREWLLAGGVTPVIVSAGGFYWSDSDKKLWMEARQYSKVTTGYKVSGYVARGFSPKSYLIYSADKDNLYSYYVSDSVINNGKLVIVEDLLSALKCSQIVDSIAIFGVHPKLSIISKILQEKYKEAYIFLDADNPEVRMKAREIPKRLPFIKCKIIELGYDPKYCSIEQLQELIK